MRHAPRSADRHEGVVSAPVAHNVEAQHRAAVRLRSIAARLEGGTCSADDAQHLLDIHVFMADRLSRLDGTEPKLELS